MFRFLSNKKNLSQSSHVSVERSPAPALSGFSPLKRGRGTENETLISHFTVSLDLAILNRVFTSQAISPLN